MTSNEHKVHQALVLTAAVVLRELRLSNRITLARISRELDTIEKASPEYLKDMRGIALLNEALETSSESVDKVLRILSLHLSKTSTNPEPTNV